MPAVTVKEAVLAFVVAVPITACVVFDVGALFWHILITLIVLGLFALGVWKAVELTDTSDWLN